MHKQSVRKSITDRPQHGLVCLHVAVELVRCAEESICLVQRYCRNCQPVAAMCDRDRGGGDTAMGKPGSDKLESLWVCGTTSLATSSLDRQAPYLRDKIFEHVREEEKENMGKGIETYFGCLGSLTW
jgi:hypothetical protein